MTEHEFKVDGMVQTKPMKVIGEHHITDSAYRVLTQFSDDSVKHGFRPEQLIPIPATDAEVVERVARAICTSLGHDPDGPTCDIYFPDDPHAHMPWAGYRQAAQAAITALTSSGYTRSPKPDVNQMMLEALKDIAKVETLSVAGGNLDVELCKVLVDILGEIKAKARLAIAAGSGE